MRTLETHTVGYRGRLRNVSQHGVAFIVCGPMPPGSLVDLEGPMGPNLQYVEKRGVVRRCRRVEGMIYEIGVEFEDCTTRGSSETTTTATRR